MVKNKNQKLHHNSHNHSHNHVFYNDISCNVDCGMNSILFSIMNFLTVVMGLNMQCKEALLLLDPSFLGVCFTFRLGMIHGHMNPGAVLRGFSFFIFFSLLNKVMIRFNLLFLIK